MNYTINIPDVLSKETNQTVDDNTSLYSQYCHQMYEQAKKIFLRENSISFCEALQFAGKNIIPHFKADHVHAYRLNDVWNAIIETDNLLVKFPCYSLEGIIEPDILLEIERREQMKEDIFKMYEDEDLVL